MRSLSLCKKCLTTFPFNPLFIMTFLFLAGCTKELTILPKPLPKNHEIIEELESLMLQNQVINEGGILSFPDNLVFVKIINFIEENNIPDSSLNYFESKIGFNSFRQKYIKTLYDLEKIMSEDEKNIFFEKNKEIINKETYLPEFSLRYAMPLVNTLRLVKIQGIVYKYLKDAVVFSFDGKIESLLIVEKEGNTSDLGFFYKPVSIQPRGFCSNTYYEWKEDGKRAARISYEVNKDIRYQEIEECKDTEVWDFATQSWKLEYQCSTVKKPVSVGVAFKRLFWSWHAYNTELLFNGNIEITSDNETYETSWDFYRSSAKMISHSATWSPSATVSNPGGFDVNKVKVFFDTRGLGEGAEINHQCN